jgi:hypothetical protein
MVFFEALNREWRQSRRPLSAAFVVVALAWLGAFAFVTWTPDNYMQVFAVDQCRTGWVDLGRPLMDPLYCVLFQGRFQPQLQLVLGIFAYSRLDCSSR